MSEAPIRSERPRADQPLPRGLSPARIDDPHAQPGNQALSFLHNLTGNGLDLFYASRSPVSVPHPPVYRVPEASEIPPGYHVVHGITLCVQIDPSSPDWQAHHWIELYDESYGWYPRDPVDRRDPDRGSAQTVSILGAVVPGELNAQHWDPPGTPRRDRAHGTPAHRYTVIAPDGFEFKDVAPRIRAFATGFREMYAWNGLGVDCVEFIGRLMEDVGLFRYQKIPPGTPVT